MNKLLKSTPLFGGAVEMHEYEKPVTTPETEQAWRDSQSTQEEIKAMVAAGVPGYAGGKMINMVEVEFV